ncbi:MAG: NADH-quinone oxidoreductase subunit L [Planctomycetes bacterium]|nr:NADH-quinone oxidoreductase subunit L [Planctomycetota bacterium]
MSDPIGLALAIPALPLAAALLAWLAAGNKALKNYAHLPLVAACATAAVLAFLLLNTVLDGSAPNYVSKPVTWFAAGHLKVNFTITVDALSTVMLGMITFIATMIAVFSGGYMKGDKGFPRFFAVMSLFVFSMCGLVLANNFLLLVAFWEGVGLCSYLLVGYYYEKPSAADAARKAFLVTRLGDTGFLLGIFMLWKLGGWNTDLTALFEHIAQHPPGEGQLTLACLLLFCGAVGKSAQFPLYVWLPDAMEGPTPVSALIHAATMVTAGVYLLARCAPLFAKAPAAQITVAWIGGITALLAAFIALAQTDLKRILAYSTVSQLGFMFMALGTSGAIDPTFAVAAAMFHLFTHAFFKALLFLAAGSVMHAMGNVIDVRRFSGLRKVMPVTHLTFLCGAAALAGFPLLSGFWSKDLVLESLTEASESPSKYSAGYFALFLVACTTAFLTAFYTFRAYFLTFWGPEKVPEEAGHHAHESPSSMTMPLLVLAVGAVFVGGTLEPFTHWFSDFLSSTPSLDAARKAAEAAPLAHHLNWTLVGVSTALALAGIGAAFALYRNGGAEKAPLGLDPVFALSRDKLYVDELYHAVLVKPAEVLAFLARVFDGFLDALSRLVAAVPRFLGAWVRPIQTGLVQFYALSMALGLAVFLSFVVFRITR